MISLKEIQSYLKIHLQAGKNRLFLLLAGGMIVSSVIVQIFNIDVFPFSHYPMYSYKIGGVNYGYQILCSRRHPGRVLPNYLMRPLYPKYISRSIEKWQAVGDDESIDKALAILAEGASRAGFEVTSKDLFFFEFTIDKELYVNYLRFGGKELPYFPKPCVSSQETQVQ